MEVALVWIVLICCTTFVAALAVGKDRRPGLTPEARLAQRFADGEIDEGEFLVQLSMVRDAKQASELNP